MRRLFFVALLLLAGPAHAHVTANPDHGIAGSYFETAFRVSHGCEGSPTTSVSIKFPPGTIVAKPQAKPGWTVEVRKSKLPKPVAAGHGKMAEEQIDEIVWSGGTLADDQYDTFGVLTKLPETAGTTLWFPVTQRCGNGSQSWIEIPRDGQQWHELKSPAPFVKIDAAPDAHHHH